MMRRQSFSCYFLTLMLVVTAGLSENPVLGAPAPTAQKAGEVSVVDGGAGPCSVEFTVTDAGGKPVYAALINVHVTYGFMGLHKLDLSVYTNAEGKAKFAGLPAKVQKPPLVFRSTKEKETGVAVYNPASECQAKHDIVLQNP